MKRSIVLSALMVMFAMATYGQNYMVVNSEKVFKAVPAYTSAMSTIDKLSEQYQKNIDNAYKDVEQMYNEYQEQKQYLSQSGRQSREDAIINREKEIAKYQQDVLGPNGDVMRKRVEILKPIQDKIFAVINKYAVDNNFALVLDVAANPMVLYYSPSADKTDEIIKLTKIQ